MTKRSRGYRQIVTPKQTKKRARKSGRRRQPRNPKAQG